MNSCSNAQSKEVGCHQDAPHGIMNLSEHGETPLEPPEDDNEDEDEDGDVDFNPFLKDTPSPEASSSPISEVEFLDAEIADSNGDTITSVGLDSSKLSDKVKGSAVGDSEHREDEIVMQSSVSSGGSCQTELEKDFLGKVKKRKLVSISEPGIETVQGNENGFGEGAVVDDEVDVRNLGNTTNSRDPIMDIDDEDAICRRTRARYSLASFTLDELETFLQETDDEDDLQNVDDEEEYKKFLASVLQGGDGDGQADQENNNIDDDDEDNDADFEIEIEEALESDIDENIGANTRKDDYEEAGRRPETRQKRRQKASTKNQKKLLQPTNRPLRPLVPIMPNAPIAPFHACEGRSLTPGAAPRCLSSTVGDSSLSSFTPHQFGQLHCLIHEHVQLLIQIYSLCMLEPSRQHVASQVQGLISEMLSKRDQALAWRSVAYPDFCFRPPYVHASVDELSIVYPEKCISDSSLTHNAQRDCFSVEMSHLCNHFPSEGRCDYVSNEGAGSCQTMRGFSWLPFIGGPLLSILDVAPLNLVGRYMDDVKLVREHRRRHMEETCDFRIEREPLFPLPSFPAVNETSGDASTGTVHPSAETALSSSPSHQPTKKTLAATLVESSKKQSVALVPKEIVKLSQRFFPLFNPALFPRKPPPLPVVNRVLFTDAEDELLAMGLMECNTDWKAIQQRFLPCKSKHQIFVRQKNRCSSKAPENPIKAVRRMKTSPLTVDEIARIQEGLRVFKLDWMSIWKFMVPHRDPSLLPRQWRIALGIQKSYKIDAAQKEKRRLYESKRRKIRAADSANWETACQREGCQTNILGEKNSGYDSIDNEDETYVHEAFLADWRPGTFNCRSSVVPCSNIREKNLHVNAQSQGGSCIKGQLNACWSQESQPQNSSVKKFPHALANSEHPYTSSQFPQVRQSASDTLERNPPTSDLTLKSSPLYMRSYRGRRANNAHLVKLAPDLPPVNLPSSARVISQSAFRSYQCGPLVKASVAGGGIDGSAITRAISELPNVTKVGTVHLMEARGTKSNSLKCNASNSCLVDSNLVRDDCVTEEKGTESDLQMHPLLFEAPEDGCLPYYPLNCSNRTSSSFSFLSGSQPQVSLSLFSNPHQANPSSNCSYKSSKSKKTTSTSCGIDFHPLLQMTDEVNGESVTACSTAPISVALGFLNSSDANQTVSRINTTPLGTKTYRLNEKVNELDLEINLSYTSRMEKAIGVTPSNNAGRCSIDNVGDQSLPEIVMEQEELSDSDEDNGEHVEFECEEMADSEGEEESDCEQIDDTQNKDAPNLAVEKVSSIVDYDDQQWELRIQGNCQGDVSIPGEDSTPSVTLGLKSHGKVVANNSSWLRLDSQAAGCPLSANKVHVDSLNGKGSATKVRASCHPNKSCKKTISSAKGATAQKHVMDMPQQLSLTSNLLRKSRKRATRSNLNLNTQMPVESSDSIGNDKIG